MAPGVDRDAATDYLPGLIEYFEAIAVELDRAGSTEFSRPIAEAAFAHGDLSKYTIATTIRGLSLMKTGRFDSEYARRIAVFDWQRLYAQQPGIFQFFAEWLAKQFRYVLIDSRTGLSDTGGICTILLPDKLVLAFTANRQSLYGVTELVARGTAHRRASDDHRPLLVLPLPSRIDTSEPELRRLWRHGDVHNTLPGYQKLFESAFAEAYELSECSLEAYLDRVQIQHVPSYSYGEYIAVLRDSTADRLSPAGGFAAFTSYLQSDALPWEEAATPAEQVDTPDALVGRAMASLEYEARLLAESLLARMMVKDLGSGEFSTVPVFSAEFTDEQRRIVEALVSARIVVTGGTDKPASVTVNRRYLPSLTAQLRPKLLELQELLSWKRLFRPYFEEWIRAGKRSAAVWPPRSVVTEGTGFLKHYPEMFSVDEREFLERGARVNWTAGQAINTAVRSSRLRRTLWAL